MPDQRRPSHAGEELAVALAPRQLEGPVRPQLCRNADAVAERDEQRPIEHRLNGEDTCRDVSHLRHIRQIETRERDDGGGDAGSGRARERQAVQTAAPDRSEREKETGAGSLSANNQQPRHRSARAPSPASAGADGCRRGETPGVPRVGGGREQQHQARRGRCPASQRGEPRLAPVIRCRGRRIRRRGHEP